MSMSLFSYRGIFEFHWMLHYDQPFQGVGFFPVRMLTLLGSFPTLCSLNCLGDLKNSLPAWAPTRVPSFSIVALHISSSLRFQLLRSSLGVYAVDRTQQSRVNETESPGSTVFSLTKPERIQNIPELLNHLPLSISNNIYNYHLYLSQEVMRQIHWNPRWDTVQRRCRKIGRWRSLPRPTIQIRACHRSKAEIGRSGKRIAIYEC